MSSRYLNKKPDDKNDKTEQEALKEVEIVAELAQNEKTRKEAEKLIETVDNGSISVQEQEQEAIETVLDETKRTIKQTVNEARIEIPKYTQAMGELQEETIQATKEIGYDLIELQREAASLVPNFQEKFMSYYVPWAYPNPVTEYYSRMVDNFVDNIISATNLVNTLIIVNMESIQRLSDSTKEYWRVVVENAKAISRSMDSGKDGKTVEKWDENLLLQRLCEAFKKAKDGGQKHVAVSDFHEQMEGLELGAVLEILKNEGEKKGIIEIDTKIIRPTPYGIEKFKQIDSSFQW